MKRATLFLFLLTALFVACKKVYTPKPYGYFRIDFPEKEYTDFAPDNCPFAFQVPKYGVVEKSSADGADPCWYDIHFPEYKGSIYLSYKPVQNNIDLFIEDARNLTYKHTVKAEAISEQKYIHHEKNVYGLLYKIKGEAASSVQFFLTDSTEHFLRGSLYFNVQPNKDSLAPVIEFFEKDVVHLINTFEWK